MSLPKFLTCLDDFVCSRFANLFYNNSYYFKNIELIFIADPYDFKANPERQAKMRGHKFDMLIAQRIPKFFGNIFSLILNYRILI